MLEGAFNLKLAKALRSHIALQEAVVIKHCQMYAAGVPDFSISMRARTIWVECKMFPNEPTKLQYWMLNKLGEGGAWVQASKDGRKCALFHNHQVIVLEFVDLVEAIVRLVVND